jgi:hypothetical protein
MGIFPDRLKFSEVKPLYKKGNRAELYNYKPVSLCPIFYKLLKEPFIKDCTLTSVRILYC